MKKLFDFVSLPSDAIEVKVIKRPKQKPLKQSVKMQIGLSQLNYTTIR